MIYIFSKYYFQTDLYEHLDVNAFFNKQLYYIVWGKEGPAKTPAYFSFLTTKTYKWASAECLLYKADNLVSLRFSYTKWEITNKEKK